MKLYYIIAIIMTVLSLFSPLILAQSDSDVNVKEQLKTPDPVSDEKLTKNVEYAKGSVCSYCRYCEFCKLCDKDCPCEKSEKKPNCHMCKYCSYCYLCSALCDTICQPGGVLDSVSGAIVNSLPTFNRGEVDSDLDSVAAWTSKDEL